MHVTSGQQVQSWNLICRMLSSTDLLQSNRKTWDEVNIPVHTIHIDIHTFAHGSGSPDREENDTSCRKFRCLQGLLPTAARFFFACKAGSRVAFDEAAWSSIFTSFLEVLTIWLDLLCCTICDQLFNAISDCVNLSLSGLLTRETQSKVLLLYTEVKFGSEWPPRCIPMHFSALRSLTQPLLDCILYLTLTQYPYDPGTLPSSANQCVLGKVYLRSNLSRVHRSEVWLGMANQSIYYNFVSLGLIRGVNRQCVWKF